jgi:hypothetical protein
LFFRVLKKFIFLFRPRFSIFKSYEKLFEFRGSCAPPQPPSRGLRPPKKNKF